MATCLSGIQPTGRFHIGNYLGCIRQFVARQKQRPTDKKHIFLIADLHCFTKPERVSDLGGQVLETARSLIALGVDPSHVNVVRQSKVMSHTQLAWYLSCLTRFSRAENMTQFKATREEHPNVGIFTYPILQAADILLHRPEIVQVGPDQRQHLELMSELCDRANAMAKGSIFRKPTLDISATRIKSLTDETRKMSKSEPGGCLFLDDSPETVLDKIKRAKTDGGTSIEYDALNRPALANIIDIYSLLTDTAPLEIAEMFTGRQNVHLKQALANVYAAYFEGFRARRRELSDTFVLQMLEQGTRAADEEARAVLEAFTRGLHQ